MKTIVVASDGSETAHHAVDLAIDLCRETGAALEVVTVRLAPAPGRRGYGPALLEIESDAGALAVAEADAARARDQGVDAHARVAYGDPAEAIAGAAELLDADLLVVGSRGLGAVSGALLGSVSRALLQRSTIPVTIVKVTEARQPAGV